MTEFQRLLESSPNPLTRELLRAGLEEDHSPARGAERALVALGLGVGISAQSASAAAGASAALGASTQAGAGAVTAAGVGGATSTGASLLAPAALAKLFALGIAGGLGVSGGAAWVHYETARTEAPVATPSAPPSMAAQRSPGSDRQHSEHRAAPDAVEAAAPALVPDAARAAPRNTGEPGGAGAVTSGTARTAAAFAEPPRPPSNQFNPSLPGAAVGALPAQDGALAREVELIDRARTALNAGSAAAALAELERYDRERVTGTLDREARLLRIDALAAGGQRARAAELARDYLARFPKDAHEARLRALVEGR